MAADSSPAPPLIHELVAKFAEHRDIYKRATTTKPNYGGIFSLSADE